MTNGSGAMKVNLESKRPEQPVPPGQDIKTGPETTAFDSAFQDIENKERQQEKKRRVGRPSKKEKFEKEQEKIQMTAVLVAPLISFLSNFLSVRLGERWKMKQDEIKEGAKVTTAVLNRYMPNFDENAELFAFAMFWSGYVLTRSVHSIPAGRDEKKNE